MSAISDAFGNITLILSETTGLMPELVAIMVALIPIMMIAIVIKFLRRLFEKVLDMVDMS
jgi:hypothetical protein